MHMCFHGTLLQYQILTTKNTKERDWLNSTCSVQDRVRPLMHRRSVGGTEQTDMANKKEGILFPWKHGGGAQPSYVEELDGKSWPGHCGNIVHFECSV
jgi:hypothetical protein